MAQGIRTRLKMGSALVFGAIAVTPVCANAQSDESGVDQVIVTAQKRAESLQEVPVAISAITGDDFDNKQIINLEDIRNLVPNLYLEQALAGTTTPKMFIRGVGVDNQVFSFDTPIGLYFDDVYISRVTGALVDLFDVQQVEFLRGPQGTLFGRNSSAGALRLTTKLPDLEEFDGKVSLGYGTRDQVNANVAVGGPLIEDKLGFRLTFMSRQNDGFQTDQTGQRFMNNNINAIRGSLLFKPAENVDVILRGDYMTDHSDPTQGSNFRFDTDNDLYTFERTLTAPNVNRVEPWGTSLTINADFGAAALKSVTAYRELVYRNAGDVDGLAAVESFEVQQQDLDEWQFSQEVFLTGDSLGSLPLKWTTGVFYLHEENDFTWALRIFSPPTTQNFLQDTDTFAVYGQATIPLTDRFNVTGGVRYSYEKKSLTATQTLADGTPNVGFQFNDAITANKVNWHAAGDYEIFDEVRLYVNAGTGFRSGGFNGSARDVASILSGSFGPETVFNIEGGAKTQLFDNRVRLNVNYFASDYKGLQQAVTLSDGTISTTNVSATVRGIEAELTAVPTDGLELTATLGTMKDDIKDSTLQLKDTPKIQWRIGGIYTFPLASDRGEFRIGADVSHTASYFNGTLNEPAGLVEPYELYNAQLAYRTPDEHWQFKLSGQNLGDHRFATHTFDIAAGFISSVHFPSNPRRWMFTVDYTF